MTPPALTSTRSSARASAPGSLMVLGEHAVLHGYRAIACAVNLRLSVQATRRTDGRVHIVSSLGQRDTALDSLDCSPPFQFASTTLQEFVELLPGGVDLHIQSEMRDDLGLGSSAAVTVATYAALDALAGRVQEPEALQVGCRRVIRRVQGLGSGADAAASILGGIVAYTAEPLSMQRVCNEFPLVVAYSGAKEKTAAVIAKVEQLRAAHAHPVEAIYGAMDALSQAAPAALASADWTRLGELLNMGQGLMEAIGVSTPRLNEMLAHLRGASGIYGAKISGSGLGDCIIGLGMVAPGALPYPLLPVKVSGRGLEVEFT